MGRTAIYMVIGMSTILLFFGKTMTSVSTDSIDNAITYYENTQRYNIAVAGANLACNKLFFDRTWRDGFSNVSFNGGQFTVTVEDSASGKVVVTSVGTYQTQTHTVKVLLSPSSFAKFAMYSGNVSAAAKLRSGDTIQGAIHFNNKLVTQGNPVFYGKATMGSLQTTSGTPTFLGGYETGVNIPFPDFTSNANDIKTQASSNGFYQNGGQLWIKFLSDGTVQYKTNPGNPWNPAVSLSTFAPNGQICINNGELHIQGTLNGSVTVASVVTGMSPTASAGSTFIEDNVQYATDPLVNPSTTNMLGVVSAGNLTIQKAPIRMDGAYFTNQNAKLNSGYINNSPTQKIKIVGSFISRDINSTDFGTGANKGGNFHMIYDTRMETNPPSNFPFPSTNSFEILSWFE
jgi:hypothetical protein